MVEFVFNFKKFNIIYLKYYLIGFNFKLNVMEFIKDLKDIYFLINFNYYKFVYMIEWLIIMYDYDLFIFIIFKVNFLNKYNIYVK